MVKPSISPDDLRRGLASGRMDRRTAAKVLASAGIASTTLAGVARPATADDPGFLQVFTWSGYDIPELHPGFIEKHGKSPEFSLFADNDEAVEKVRAGYMADIAVPTAYTVVRWYEGDMIRPIDPSRLSNWPDLFPELTRVEGMIFEGRQYAAPWAWGNSSVVYRTDLAPEYVGNESWKILFDEKYTGKIGARDAMDGVVLPAALILGFDPYNMNDDQIAQVRELMVKGNEIARFYWSSQADIEQALAAGEIVAAYAWNDGYKRLKEAGVPVAYMVPKEGILVWCDAQVVLKVADADEQLIYDYLDATLSPEVGKFMIESYGYGSSNTKAFDIADPAIIASLGIENPIEVMNSGFFFKGMEGNYRDRLIEMFEEVKAGT
jgi:spermidine/putrescine-binding protein